MASRVEEYTNKFKQYVETAAKVYQEDILKCSEKQQEKLTQMMNKWEEDQRKPTKDPEFSIITPNFNQVPEQVEINTTASQMGMSRRSVDPPDETPVRQHRQTIQMYGDVRVTDGVAEPDEKSTQGNTLTEAVPRQNRWKDVEDVDRWTNPTDRRAPAQCGTPKPRQDRWQQEPPNMRHQAQPPRRPPPRNPYDRREAPSPHREYEQPQYQERGINLGDMFDQEFELAFNKDEQ
jgi:hypothetical protein